VWVDGWFFYTRTCARSARARQPSMASNGDCSFILRLFANPRLRLFAPWLSFGSLIWLITVKRTVLLRSGKFHFFRLFFAALFLEVSGRNTCLR
jgi:hypothetical protein